MRKRTSFFLVMNRNDLLLALRRATADLYLMSETDAPFEGFFWVSSQDFSPAHAQSLWGKSAPTSQSLDTFFAPLIQTKDWHTPEDQEQVRRFAHLKRLLEKNLNDIAVYLLPQGEEKICWIVGTYAPREYLLLRTFRVDT